MNADPNESFVSCTCNTCSGNIEYDLKELQTGTTIPCPHCGIDTILFNPRANVPVSAPLESTEVIFSCPKCNYAMPGHKALLNEKINCPACSETFIPSDKKPEAKADSRSQFITTTGNEVSGRTIESYLGIARGIVVRSPNLEQQLFGGLKTIVGGNIKSFANVCEAARSEAYSRMVEHAKTMNADAIIAMRYDATEFGPGITEVLAYGTAVKLAA